MSCYIMCYIDRSQVMFAQANIICYEPSESAMILWIIRLFPGLLLLYSDLICSITLLRKLSLQTLGFI